VDFFSRLFDASDFPPRWHCGAWTAGHGWLHIVSDLGVWSAYLAIPCVLGFFVLRRKDLPLPGIFWLFGAFILACGTTHLMEAMIFWWPAYRLAGVIKVVVRSRDHRRMDSDGACPFTRTSLTVASRVLLRLDSWSVQPRNAASELRPPFSHVAQNKSQD
jgi:hypothetical protein